MRLSAVDPDACRYRVYDYPAGGFRNDLCWVDDVLNQVGVGHANITAGEERVFLVEQRKRVLIIPGMYWVALDLPEEEVKKENELVAFICTPEAARDIATEYLKKTLTKLDVK